jgi:hypothetical protein
MRFSSFLTLSLLLTSAAGLPCAQSAETDTQFIFINGGISPTQNYSIHEQDLLAFKKGLFTTARPENIHILNAGGPDTRITQILPDGSFKRDDEGRISVFPSLLPEKYPAATLENIGKLFTSLKNQEPPPSRVTAVFGDHGGPSGVSLWGNEDLSASQIYKEKAKLPASTLVRELHLHCFGAAAMIDATAEVPAQESKVLPYFKNRYPLNRCAAAMSQNDEVGQYYSWDKDWEQGAWTQLLHRLPHPTLTSLKEVFNQDPELRTSPSLTSDYFLRDVAHYYCQAAKKSPKAPLRALINAGPCAPDGKPAMPEIEVLHRKLQEKLCGEAAALSDEIFEKHKAYLKSDQVGDEYAAIQAFWKNKYLTLNQPDLVKAYVESQIKIEALQKNAVLGKLTSHELAKKREELKKLRDDFPVRYQFSARTLDDDPGFKTYLSHQLTNEWLRSKSREYPNFTELRFSSESNAESFTPERLSQWELGQRNSIQFEIKRVMNKLYSQRRELGEQLLSDPRMTPFKEMYENLKACENSSLN